MIFGRTSGMRKKLSHELSYDYSAQLESDIIKYLRELRKKV